MEQELMVTGDKPIVGAAGKREKLFEKLNSFKIDNLTASEQDIARKHIDKLVDAFVTLSKAWFGVSVEQMKKLDLEELKELLGVVYEKAHRRRLAHELLIHLSVAGMCCWLFVDNFYERPTYSWQLVYNNNALEKLCGKNNFPMHRVQVDLLAC